MNKKFWREYGKAFLAAVVIGATALTMGACQQPTDTGTSNVIVRCDECDTEKVGGSCPNPNCVTNYIPDPVLTPLATPVASMSGAVLSWAAVPNAAGYQIYAGNTPTGSPLSAAETSRNIGNLNLAVGTHLLSVRALAGQSTVHGNSERSAEVEVSIRETIGMQPSRLREPQGLVIEDGILSWDANPAAMGFRVYLPAPMTPVFRDGPNINLEVRGLPVGRHNIEVRTLADPENQWTLDSEDVSSIEVPIGQNQVDPTPLTAPVVTPPSGTGTTISWAAVPNAVGYAIYVGNTREETLGNQLSFNVANLGLTPGVHSNIRVRALAQGGTEFANSPLSEPVTVTIPETVIPPEHLDAPQGLQINNGILTWDNVTQAHGFRVYIPARTPITVSATDRSIDLAEQNLPLGTHTISVRTLADPQNQNLLDSEEVSTIQFVVAPIILDTPIITNHTNTSMTWNAVEGATGYQIYTQLGPVGGVITGTSVDFTTLGLSHPGQFDIQVQAIGNGTTHLNSPNSATKQFMPSPLSCNHADIRDCAADIKNFFVQRGVTTPNTYTNWNDWVESHIKHAVIDAETARVLSILSQQPGGVFQGRFPTGIAAGFFFGSVTDNHVITAAEAQNIGVMRNFSHHVFPGFTPSFGTAPFALGSALLVHGDHRARGGNMHGIPSVGATGGQFPCLSREAIEQAIEFHRIALENMFNFGYYHVGGTGNEHKVPHPHGWYAHNVFDHFSQFNISATFTNNPAGLELSGTPNVIDNNLGIWHNPNGFGSVLPLPPCATRP